MSDAGQKRTKKFTPAGIIFAALGLLLFAYFVKKAGVSEIVGGIRRLGAGFLIVLLISTARPLVRSLSWTLCFEAPNRLRFRDALRAYLIGDSIGTLLPLGIVVSEPTKAALVRDRVPFSVGFAALVVENLFYSLSVALFILLGTLTLLLSFPLPKPLWIASVGALVGVVVLIFAAYFVIHRQLKFVSGALEFLYGRGVARGFLEDRRGRVRSIEDRIYGFYERNSGRFLPILLLEACFHLAGILEVYVTLLFISDTRPTLLASFLLESVNRFINVAFKFIPLRVGIDEAGTGLLARILQFGTASGVTLAIVRKARIFCWTLVGVAFLVRRGLSLKSVTEEAEAAISQAGARAQAASED